MRIISGTYKGQPLKAVPGNQTRPTTDKMKETMFNIIGPYFSGGLGLDLFAGSGGLGIEALSRGLDKVIFVDRDMKAIQTIKGNVSLCKLTDVTEVYRNDAERALKAIIKRKLQFTCVFLDPPYEKQKLLHLLQLINENDLLADDGTVVCEHGAEVHLPQEVGHLQKTKTGEFGTIGLSIYRKKIKEIQL